MRTHLTFIASIIVCASAVVHAEPLYVADKLVLNVYAEADQSSSRIATIETGDAVEALERVENFVRVQLADGREGWVGANYLIAQPPAIVRLKELQHAQPSTADSPPKQLTDEIARLKKQNTTLQSEVADLKKKQATAPPASAPAVSAVIESTPAERADAAPPEPPAPTVIVERSHWWAWLIAVVLAAGGGFFAGYQTLGRRVRERFGGVKVY